MDDLRIPIDPAALSTLRADPSKIQVLAECGESFRRFLDFWHFVDQETGEVRVLGGSLWSGQLEFIGAAELEQRVFYLKARKLGFSTLECAFDGWVMRFRDLNARVHLFSRRDDAAVELLSSVRFGLERLPEWMRLPAEQDTTHVYSLRAGPDDRRMAKAYPADEDTAVEATCTHGHVDEWARMRNPRRVWQAIEPSMAGSCHFVTTGMGPTNYTSRFWRKSVAEETGVLPFFVDALKRPGRDEEWLRRKWMNMPAQDARKEYPMVPEDALSGEGDHFFEGEELDRAAEETLGPSTGIDGRTYVKAWDIGRHRDAAVGTVLDVTDAVVDLVRYERYRELPYPALQRMIEEVHRAYDGPTVIELNSAGEAVKENLDLPEDEVIGFTTTGKSKPRILAGLKIGFQKELVRYDARTWSQLDVELRDYKIPDEHVVQDSVMSLAIGYAHAGEARRGSRRRGRILRAGTW